MNRSSGPDGTVPFATDIPTALGPVRLVWTDSASGPKVRRILLTGDPRPDAMLLGSLPCVREPADTHIRTLIAEIRSFVAGRDVQFDTALLDLERCPPFQRRVLDAEYGIPRGYVSTYGRIARHLGNPGAARAVGNALARNPFPLVIPCHRALRSDGSLGGFQASREMKRRLLEREGVRFRADGRAVMERVWY